MWLMGVSYIHQIFIIIQMRQLIHTCTSMMGISCLPHPKGALLAMLSCCLSPVLTLLSECWSKNRDSIFFSNFQTVAPSVVVCCSSACLGCNCLFVWFVSSYQLETLWSSSELLLIGFFFQAFLCKP